MIQHLTVSNLRSYGEASRLIQLQAEILQADGFEMMVVPSRGAAPFEQGASHYFFGIRRHEPKDREARWNLRASYTSGPLCGPLYLPFTADIPEGVTGVDSRDIRRFWSRVLAAIVRSDRRDPYYRFFAYLREVFGLGFPHIAEARPWSGKFIFLDTVVSGRAIDEIMDAFEEFGLNGAHFILLLDAEGRKVRPDVMARLSAMEQAGRATLIRVACLFTEDQGPAVSGIWSVTMPEVMQVARDRIAEFKALGAIGAGLYYVEVRARDDRSNIALTESIGWLTMLILNTSRPEIKDDQLAQELHYLTEHLKHHELTRRQATLDVAMPRLVKAAPGLVSIKASSSHALRIHQKHEDAKRIVAEFSQWSGPRLPWLDP